jgi:hypothetical protein
MIRLATLLCAITFGAGLPAVAESEWTWTGPNGGTASGARDCSASGGSYACSGQSTYVGPEGRTATRTWQGTGTATAGQRTVTTTGPDGQPRTRTFNWQRDN